MRPSIWFLATLLVVTISAGVSQAAGQDELRAEIPADDLKRIVIDADVGSVTLTGTDTDIVNVSVNIDENDSWRSDVDFDLIDDSVLEQKKSRSELRLRLKLPRGVDKDDVEEHWEVTVPDWFAARVRMGVGTVDIIGVSGGVDARAGVGTVNVDVPKGDIDARSSVGDVEVITASKSTGDIELDANVGGVRLSLRGEGIRANQGFGPGQNLQVQGDGDDHIEASANVGSVRVRVE